MSCHVARRAVEAERRLRRERREVRHALETTDVELAGFAGTRSAELVDAAATEATCRLLAHLEDRDHRLLAEIEAAERRLAAGAFGVCERCARAIGPARLRAVPTARLCIACEAMAESTSARKGEGHERADTVDRNAA